MDRALRPAREAPPFVERVEPRDGARGVWRDTPILLHVSRPVDPALLPAAVLELRDGAGRVPLRLEVTCAGRVVVVWPTRRLAAGIEHEVVAEGLRDRVGREVAAHRSSFTPGPLASDEVPE